MDARGDKSHPPSWREACRDSPAVLEKKRTSVEHLHAKLQVRIKSHQHGTSHHITSHHITSHHITSHHIRLQARVRSVRCANPAPPRRPRPSPHPQVVRVRCALCDYGADRVSQSTLPSRSRALCVCCALRDFHAPSRSRRCALCDFHAAVHTALESTPQVVRVHCALCDFHAAAQTALDSTPQVVRVCCACAVRCVTSTPQVVRLRCALRDFRAAVQTALESTPPSRSCALYAVRLLRRCADHARGHTPSHQGRPTNPSRSCALCVVRLLRRRAPESTPPKSFACAVRCAIAAPPRSRVHAPKSFACAVRCAIAAPPRSRVHAPKSFACAVRCAIAALPRRPRSRPHTKSPRPPYKAKSFVCVVRLSRRRADRSRVHAPRRSRAPCIVRLPHRRAICARGHAPSPQGHPTRPSLAFAVRGAITPPPLPLSP